MRRRAGETSAAVTALILDTATGRVLHQQAHAGARGPAATAFFDNVAALQFWDERAARWHFAVMELYDHSAPVPAPLAMVSGALLPQPAALRTSQLANQDLLGDVNRRGIHVGGGAGRAS